MYAHYICAYTYVNIYVFNVYKYINILRDIHENLFENYLLKVK